VYVHITKQYALLVNNMQSELENNQTVTPGYKVYTQY